ncbi:uncharacterized protein [Triticum aestivum]|uniref:uncharacterized protein isoform X2 n=1 Tax=Triticum aestivum TaxID=4565 RepID=UPI001D02B636|nr:uncharacterized protein LOC123134059 isoform X2 [Triticum aestivum]
MYSTAAPTRLAYVGLGLPPPFVQGQELPLPDPIWWREGQALPLRWSLWPDLSGVVAVEPLRRRSSSSTTEGGCQIVVQQLAVGASHWRRWRPEAAVVARQSIITDGKRGPAKMSQIGRFLVDCFPHVDTVCEVEDP